MLLRTLLTVGLGLTLAAPALAQHPGYHRGYGGDLPRQRPISAEAPAEVLVTGFAEPTPQQAALLEVIAQVSSLSVIRAGVLGIELIRRGVAERLEGRQFFLWWFLLRLAAILVTGVLMLTPQLFPQTAPPAQAPSPAAPGGPAASSDVRITARTQERTKDRVFAAGDVVLRSGDILLLADRIDYDLASKDVLAEGNVVVQSAGQVIRAERVHAGDRRRLREATRIAWGLVRSPPLARETEGAVALDDEIVAADDRLDAYMRAQIGTYCHALGTAPMGPPDDGGAVVDEHCQVRGVRGLWVADASVMPAVPRVVPHLSVMMIAERVAEWLRRANDGVTT